MSANFVTFGFCNYFGFESNCTWVVEFTAVVKCSFALTWTYKNNLPSSQIFE